MAADGRQSPSDCHEQRLPRERRRRGGSFSIQPARLRRQIMQATTALQSVSSPLPSEAATGSVATQPAADLHAQIAERAYLRAQVRGFAPGLELDDWLAAEAEIMAGASAPEPAVPA
jgi:hypothetical protein